MLRTALVAGLVLCVAFVAANPGHGCGARGGHCEKQESCRGVVHHSMCNGGTDMICCVPRRGVRKHKTPAAKRSAAAAAAAVAAGKSAAAGAAGTGGLPAPMAAATGGAAPTGTVASKAAAAAAGGDGQSGPRPPKPIVRGKRKGRRGRGRRRGIRGVDLSTLASKKSLKCLKEAGWDFVVVRAYQSNNKPDVNAPASLKNAAAAGYKPQSLGVYLFPCAKCGNPRAQLNGMIRHLEKNGAAKLFKRIWLDVEGSYWPGQTGARTFFNELLAACKELKTYQCGVYTSESQWSAIMGKSFGGGKSVPLWYPHYQYIPEANTKDFAAFGGWSRPHAKQYNQNQQICGVGVDVNVLA